MPAFLANEPAYTRYLAGGIELPDYETVSFRVKRVQSIPTPCLIYTQDENGHVVLTTGEVFCRVPGCTSKEVSQCFHNTFLIYLEYIPSHLGEILHPRQSPQPSKNPPDCFPPPSRPRWPALYRGQDGHRRYLSFVYSIPNLFPVY